MQLAEALQEKLYDIRLRDKLLFQGKISKDDLKKYLDQLEDRRAFSIFTEEENKTTESQTEQSISS